MSNIVDYKEEETEHFILGYYDCFVSVSFAKFV